MACREALIPNVVTARPDMTVEETLEIISQNGIRSVPVVDNHGKFLGMFGLHALMDDLLPTAARVEGGITDLGFVIGGAPGAAKRIRKLAPQSVAHHVVVNPSEAILSPDLSMLETIRRISKHGSPLPVVGDDGEFVGLVSEQSCLSYLHRVLDDVEAEESAQSISS
ncbi:MAG: CBS domain-containing protein [Pseudobdellovibrionaceae bacterium]